MNYELIIWYNSPLFVTEVILRLVLTLQTMTISLIQSSKKFFKHDLSTKIRNYSLQRIPFNFKETEAESVTLWWLLVYNCILTSFMRCQYGSISSNSRSLAYPNPTYKEIIRKSSLPRMSGKSSRKGNNQTPSLTTTLSQILIWEWLFLPVWLRQVNGSDVEDSRNSSWNFPRISLSDNFYGSSLDSGTQGSIFPRCNQERPLSRSLVNVIWAELQLCEKAFSSKQLKQVWIPHFGGLDHASWANENPTTFAQERQILNECTWFHRLT